jgi:hypothetical protein
LVSFFRQERVGTQVLLFTPSLASMCLTTGENVMWVSAQMGHKDWGFTARTYAKFIDSD